MGEKERPSKKGLGGALLVWPFFSLGVPGIVFWKLGGLTVGAVSLGGLVVVRFDFWGLAGGFELFFRRRFCFWGPLRRVPDSPVKGGTVDFTVLALRASVIPVYRDGFQFVIPSGQWSVVEACSGVRYLIASLMVGTLFAHINYRSPRRRSLFMLVALAVPIVANWLRAYMIVMIGHLSDNKLAAGVDHLIYGWVFFGIVIGAMFLIGARWSEQPAPPRLQSGAVPQPTGPFGGHRLWTASTAMLVVLLLPSLLLDGLRAREQRGAPRLVEPELAGVRVIDEPALPAWQPEFVNPSASFASQYEVNGQPVGLYLAYYRAQAPDRKLVSSINALVRSNDPSWVQSSIGMRSVVLDSASMLQIGASDTW